MATSTTSTCHGAISIIKFIKSSLENYVMVEGFKDKEKEILLKFVSNSDKDVFALKNLPEVVKGALFSRYSRSAKTLRRLLLDEFIGNEDLNIEELATKTEQDLVITEKAEEFYDRVLVGYGDDSVAELAGAHLALENISMVATKMVEDARIGLSPLEKSTRYVYFDKKVDDRWLYYREPVLMGEFADVYTKTCDHSFETYARLIPEISKYVGEKLEQGEMSDRAYKSTLRAKTCDLLRGLLPASTLTNMGFFGNGRAFEYLITKMYASNLAELRNLAGESENELKTVIPSFVKRASGKYGVMLQDYLKATHGNIRKISPKAVSDECKRVSLIDYDKNAYDKVIVSTLYPYSHLSMEELEGYVEKMSDDEKKKIMEVLPGDRKNRRHKPGRGFERVYYTFEVCANFGAYRDIHRHRILSQQRQLLNTNLGYDMAWEISDAGFENEFKDAMETAKNAYDEIAKKYIEEAQYVVPLAYKLRWQMVMNLREAYYFCELRSTMQGHRDYRLVAQDVYRKIKEVHPLLVEGMKFVDLNEYEFERLEAEKFTDERIKEVEEKYGAKK